MVLVNRWYQLLQLLLTRQVVSLSTLKTSLRLTTQTIKKTITLLNEQLIGIAEINEADTGYSLRILDSQAFNQVLSGSLKQQSDFNSTTKRIAYLLNRLLFSKDYLLIDALAEELQVSRGTVNSDLKRVKKLAAQFDLTLDGTPNRGIKLLGAEVDLRLLHLHHVYDYFPLDELSPAMQRIGEQLVTQLHLEKRFADLWFKVLTLTIKRIKLNFPLNEPNPYYVNCLEETEINQSLRVQFEAEYQLSLGKYDSDFLSFPLNNTQIRSLGQPEEFLRSIF